MTYTEKVASSHVMQLSTLFYIHYPICKKVFNAIPTESGLVRQYNH